MIRLTILGGMTLAVTLALAGCGANYHSIYRHQLVPDKVSSMTVIDAKQRVVIASKAREVASTAPVDRPEINGNASVLSQSSPSLDVQRFCAEPSPDVFSVIAQALSGGGTFGKSADPATIQIALSAAFSSSEQGSSIPRTQTINMLRELMYRTCERYLSGGISELELPLQAIRDQRLMVSILAIEQLTGAVTPKPVSISVSAEGAAGSSAADSVARVDDAYKAFQAKNVALQSRQVAYDELTAKDKDCEAIVTAVKDKKEESLTQALKDKKPKCDAASTALAQAKKDQSEASTHYADLLGLSKNGGVPAASRGVLSDAKVPGGIDRALSGGVSEVASAVTEIVKLNFAQDEFLFLCLKVLAPLVGNRPSELINSVEGTCIEYVKSGIELQQVSNRAKIAAATQVTQRIAASLFDRFWNRVVGVDGRADASKWAALEKVIPKGRECFPAGGTRAEYESCFNKLNSDPKRKLAGVE